MNRFLTRKNVVIALISLGVIIVSIVGYTLFREYVLKRTVTFTFSSNVKSIIVSNQDSSECEENCDVDLSEITLNSTGTVRLFDGVYYILPSGENIATDAIQIDVNKNSTSFTVRPDYSDTYLNELLDKDMSAIHRVITASYPAAAGYSINRGNLYGNSEWYATSLLPTNIEAGGSVDVYYVILQKVNGTWKIAADPDLYFTYKKYPNIPREIINDVNQGIIGDE